MRRARAAVAVVLAAIFLVAPAEAAKRPRVTFIGDSIAASFLFVPQAVRTLSRGLDLKLDLRVCRRLVDPSCTYRGSTPATALELIQASGRSLGKVVIIDVGYNDTPSRYQAGLRKVMRALRAAGVSTVVWVTLREGRSLYGQTNDAIRRAARRWPELVVADWEATSAGHPWFAADGLHLNAGGATALARLLRPLVVQAACDGTCPR